MHFLIVPYPDGGHLEPALAIASGLAERGHAITFAALLDTHSVLRGTGHPCVPLFPDLFPEGSLRQFLPGKTFLKRRWHIAQLHGVLDAVERGSFRDILSAVQPDAVVLDSLFFFLGLVCVQMDVIAATYFVTLPWSTSYSVPPLTSRLDRTRSRCYPIRRALVAMHSTYRQIHETCGDPLGFTLDIKRRVARLASLLAPSSRITFRGHSVHMLLDLPELILCPEAFDWRRPPRPRRFYVGPSLRQARDADRFPWERLTPRKRLLYCALGSRVPPYDCAKSLFQSVAAAAVARGMQAVIATGAVSPMLDRCHCSDIIVVPSAPQRAVLERASVFVTHAGLGSVKEAIMAGVPMVAFPMLADQPGNTARIVDHQIGVAGERIRISPPYVGALIDRVINDVIVARSTMAMRDLFQREEQSNAAWHVLERLASAGASRDDGGGLQYAAGGSRL